MDMADVMENIQHGLKVVYGLVERVVELRRRVLSGGAGQLAIKLKASLVGFRQEVLATLRQVSSYLEQFQLAKEVVKVYVDYQSWLEEVHFTEHLEKAAGEFKE